MASMTITEFILARVAEDEERAQFVARQNEGNNWTPRLRHGVPPPGSSPLLPALWQALVDIAVGVITRTLAVQGRIEAGIREAEAWANERER